MQFQALYFRVLLDQGFPGISGVTTPDRWGGGLGFSKIEGGRAFMKNLKRII